MMTEPKKQPPTTPLWSAHILTLFPGIFPGPLGQSLSGRALQNGLWSLRCQDIKDEATDKHKAIDAPPAGGGQGMVMRADIAGKAIEKACAKGGDAEGFLRLYPSPRGQVFDHNLAHKFAKESGVMIICGRYEGLDQRIIDQYQLTEISIGDYVLSGGEMAAMVIIDSVVRLLPGVIGKQESYHQDSFENGLLEHDHYTQPRQWQGRDIPDILLSGHHQHIAQWRQENAETITKMRRPDLWSAYLAQQQRKNQDKD